MEQNSTYPVIMTHLKDKRLFGNLLLVSKRLNNSNSIYTIICYYNKTICTSILEKQREKRKTLKRYHHKNATYL
jgi:hypothetical protein